MSHPDPATLALAALGEEIPGADRDHIAACPECGAELAELRGVVRLGRGIHPEDEPSAPPPGLWQRITGELGLDAADPQPAAAPSENGQSENGRTAAGTTTTARPDRDAHPRTRRFRVRTALALAASAALIGAGIGVGGTLWATGDDTPRPRIEAQTRLDPLPAHQAVGAAFVDAPSGGESARRLIVRVSGLAPQPGFYEVWLLDRDAKKMIALGILPVDGEASFDLPANLDLDGYPVVDVSVQAYNGSPEHSGNSVVRGTLPG
ncbi:anti-sigma factor [Yinghuangia soli]|uniref:Anti-sigma factor n=1 Tax=Yinghuangia soli TaxID=2908204 RepID=A0AA41Q983_9ACTN|nr:anti-sigma factor [Yinghuangia soli]MCF2533929.1 anti-sigma factor [Yinghuangia soli]